MRKLDASYVHKVGVVGRDLQADAEAGDKYCELRRRADSPKSDKIYINSSLHDDADRAKVGLQ